MASLRFEFYSNISKKVPEMTGQNKNPVRKGEVEGQFIPGRVPGPAYWLGRLPRLNKFCATSSKD